jgi:hypothetical protein
VKVNERIRDFLVMAINLTYPIHRRDPSNSRIATDLIFPPAPKVAPRRENLARPLGVGGIVPAKHISRWVFNIVIIYATVAAR